MAFFVIFVQVINFRRQLPGANRTSAPNQLTH
jgi:hypothetical protein